MATTAQVTCPQSAMNQVRLLTAHKYKHVNLAFKQMREKHKSFKITVWSRKR